MSKVLIIDDNLLVSDMVKEFLVSHGYDVAVAHNANDGYQRAIQEPPDLILLDVHLPDVTGFQVCKVLRAKDITKQIPIIMITGEASRTDQKIKGFQAGADDYLLKPFDTDELLERMRAVMRRSEGKRPVNGHEPTAASVPPADSTAQTAIDAPARIPITQLFRLILFSPQKMPTSVALSGVSLVYLAAALALCFGGVAAAAEPTAKPALIAAAVLGTWGILVFAIVMAASLMGVAIAWGEAAGLLSLAGAPLLLKMTCAFATSALTTLSPFHFTVGPALFRASASTLSMRCDVFELWSIALLYFLLNRRLKQSRAKAAGITLLAWVLAFAIAAGLARVGPS